ncbi:hypothetical protein JKP88DRAFT_265277 [Tribonema minus]|uniref:Borealin N-terminal domain-containing protein n=1 Tax=Tribonema minus TaxID=303371 RepID=A0A836C8I6_9STRA|nr:hypothetical protein JKP88DRAFT_265277 [Tribonema minus]
MPPRRGQRKAPARGAGAQKQAAGEADENVSTNRPSGGGGEGEQAEVVEALLQELEMQVDARCQRIREEGERLKLALRNKFAVQKLRLPKSIRQMPLRQFLEDYGEDARAVLITATEPGMGSGGAMNSEGEPQTAVKGARDRGVAADAAVGRSMMMLPVLSDRRGGAALETPCKPSHAAISVMPTPGTAARLARRGEMMLSVNGSPLVVAPMMSMGVGGGGNAQQRLSTIHALEAEVASIAGGDPSALPDDMKRAAFGQLLSLQDQITQMMSTLK